MATLAHELRGPLHALGTSASLLAEDVDELDRTQVRQMAQMIHRRTMWLQGLVENLLCATSVERGGLRIHPHIEDLAEAVEDACELVEPLVTQKRQQLRVRVPEGEAPALIDRRRILQALINLIQNASKFSDPGNEIEVSLERQGTGGAWRICVADRGVGLPTSGVDRLFAPYYRAAEAERSGKEGLGLGLAIVKSVADAHDGRASAEARDGGGARFWMELPALTGLAAVAGVAAMQDESSVMTAQRAALGVDLPGIDAVEVAVAA